MTISVSVAHVHAAGYSRNNRLHRNAAGDTPFEELAMTNPEMTKKISTPTQSSQLNGVSVSNETT